MLSRVKICALLTLAGALTAGAATLDPTLKNSAFQPGGNTAPITTKATVIKPVSAGFWGRFKLWRGAKVEKIDPAPQPPVQVEMNKFVFKKAQEAPAPQPEVKTAGSGR